ncbi:hypothetical protein [Escherichia coli]|uniref:hypothetical protein n=1 Tax=Escherichia coli TaxID=562 RepID=UPI002033F2C2|nr:hypothetical protein [Escherichia coli]MBB2646250.1 hypothetical protein [Escherichia coli]
MYPDSLEQRIAYRNKLVRFGRAIAQGEFIARDAINAIKRSTAPDKTTSLGNTLSDGNVKAMIIAEHKNMGLPARSFLMASKVSIHKDVEYQDIAKLRKGSGKLVNTGVLPDRFGNEGQWEDNARYVVRLYINYT